MRKNAFETLRLDFNVATQNRYSLLPAERWAQEFLASRSSGSELSTE